MTVKTISFAPGAPAPSPVLVENVTPAIDGGRYPVKREVGDVLTVSADIFREGHDKIAAVVKYRRWNDDDWREAEMRFVDNDRWEGSFVLTENTRYQFTVEAYPDDFETWRDEITKKLAAGLDIRLELQEGMLLLEDVLRRAERDDAAAMVSKAMEQSLSATTQARSLEFLLDPAAVDVAQRHRSRVAAVEFEPYRSVIVDRVRARFAAWYSMFPRSAGTHQRTSATFKDVEKHLPRLRDMGFDVLYFTPIHPIGMTNRKGKNNTLNPGPSDPGVPYAIGSEQGGHFSIEPSLGTIDDFRELLRSAEDHEMEIALDIALNASPDHPWATEHPEWFTVRPDGSIKYAENPPKRYEDIYPINFQSEDWQGLWDELKRMILFWVKNGVKTFRVDNPHTKPTAFWEWLITEVHRTNPEVIFLSEAFTRPKVMRALAKAGFAQSYTYFTWRNFKQEIVEYATELTQSEMKEYFRGNFFTNTHDILPYILQEGGRSAFRSRVVLAATLSSVYGIYSGYELCENTPVAGKEEYLNSEKYEYKVWDWDRPGNIINDITRLNQIRREHPALQEYDNLTFLEASSESVICYIKSLPEQDSHVMVVVNLDPFQPHESTIEAPYHVLGIPPDAHLQSTELFSNSTRIWQGSHQTVYLDPSENPAMIFSLKVWQQKDYEEPCF
ncbi:alpha-1,4-glucan--maltose-1-phosphate maltosyltransferase [soil metagenome]